MSNILTLYFLVGFDANQLILKWSEINTPIELKMNKLPQFEVVGHDWRADPSLISI
jgi:hypothetical protein